MLLKHSMGVCAGTKATFKFLTRSFIGAGVFILCMTSSHFAWSMENRDVTNDPPVISGISADSITISSAVIKWISSDPSNSQVNYGTSTAYGLSTLIDPIAVSTHSMILNSLAPGTLYHFRVLSRNAAGILTTSPDATFTTASLASSTGSLDTHPVKAYPAGKVVPWTANPALAYDSVMQLAWNYLLNSVPNEPSSGKPAYYSRSYLLPNNQQLYNWPHNPAGLYAMLVESALKYYAYSGNANVMQLAIDVCLWQLDHGMTSATDNWPSVPYSEGVAGSVNYSGADPSDGAGNLEPDKIGELGYAWLQLYKYNGNTRFRDAAIRAANVLSSKIRTGTLTQSPWAFRVKASNGNVVENYCSNIIGPISLLDGLIAAGLGNVATYQTVRTAAWSWMMAYPMQNNVWSQYFEDVAVQANYNSNLNQYNANMVARYLLEHPEFDPNWEAHVRGIITWVENIFGQSNFGATIIKEQQGFFYPMGSHTSRYASVNALLYEKTGDLVAKEKAYRSFNWATYMCRSNGIVIDGPLYGSYVDANQWFTDGYGDYIRHFMTGLAAIPEWSPANQTHLLRSSSLVKNISYGTNTVNYTTYDGSAVDVLHVNFNPGTVTANGMILQQRTDLSQPGWTLNIATKTLRIFHNNATQISITASAPPDTVRVVCPGSNTYFTMQRPGTDYVFQWQIDSTNTGFVNLVSNSVHSGTSTDTLRLNNPPTAYYGFKYRCIASKSGNSIFGIPCVLKFAVTWHGNAGAPWENLANWSCNSLPDSFTDVIIPGAITNYPVINSNVTVRSIIMSSGSTLTVSTGKKLDIKGK